MLRRDGIRFAALLCGGFVRTVATLSILMMSLSAAAQVIPAFPQATLESRVEIRSDLHRVMLSPIREVRNEIRSESVIRVPVEGTGQLLQLDSDVSREDARRWYRNRLSEADATILFECSGRDCGRSNVWANQIFSQSTLYGRDADQDYLAASLVDSSGQRWLVLVYTVTRGNQRKYAWIEQLALQDGAVVPGVAAAGNRIQGPVVVPWSGSVSVRFEWDADLRRRISNLAEVPGSRVVVAGFSELGPGETLEQAVENAENAANTMGALLDRSGISSSRQIIRAIGPMVQSRVVGQPANRVEILVVAPPQGGQE
ncbi:protein of unknown function [Marinobacter daqiaonensis]|uniref:DUF4892 domain-containing protein n=1 Tax=Marinobacter daqiaonensis TaxID=650891 RepID=A0A1I6GWM3_9GAMM|nr:DUF4892 domain-containing protein [Marinobacter daqiaonensis]SFR46556.1 protein of unknown function [Marinobacter daqiaonensis]